MLSGSGQWARGAVAFMLSALGLKQSTFSIYGVPQMICAIAAAPLSEVPREGKTGSSCFAVGPVPLNLSVPCTSSSIAEVTTKIHSSHASAWVSRKPEPARATNCIKHYNAN